MFQDEGTIHLVCFENFDREAIDSFTFDLYDFIINNIDKHRENNY